MRSALQRVPVQYLTSVNPGDRIPDLEDERGRGFFLLAQMVDVLAVERSDDGLGLSFRAVRRYDVAS